MLVSDTPSGIVAYPVDYALNFVERSAENMPCARVRLNYVKMLYDVLGYDLSTDAALAAVSEHRAELVIATAGSGKTTWSQIKAIEQKLIRKSKKGNGKRISGAQILCLVYNHHNVDDMKLRHSQMVNKILAAGIKGLGLDDQINACTMHSFCEFFRKQFVAKLNLVGYKLIEEEESNRLMERAAKIIFMKEGNNSIDSSAVNRLRALYVYTQETMLGVEECTYTDSFKDLDLEVALIESIFAQYDSMKARARKYEFIDMLTKIYGLLKRDAEALKFVQSYYEYVIADEVQDFTPLMWELLKLFVSDGTPLTCIGDEDQNIYLFRGASIDDTLNFRYRFDDAKVYTLSENRRCRSVILEEAKRVISENTLRFNKEITGKKSGGSITTVPYNTLEGQAMQLIKRLKELSADEQNNSLVCYRNVENSQLAVEMAAEAGISVNCLRSCRPYSHELYFHLNGIFSSLEMPMDRDIYKCLWKVLPCKKSEFYASIGYDEKSRRFLTEDRKTHFAENNYGKLMSIRGFPEAIEVLRRLSDDIGEAPMKTIFEPIMHMLRAYFWNYKKSLNDNSELDEIFERRVTKKFSVDAKYGDVFRDMQCIKGVCSADTKIGAGVTFSTFHSLKGLEYNKVFVICMDNNVFPNFPLIEYKNYGERMEHELKEAETRLWYVAVTRAINSLTIFYNEDNPSKYVLDYLNRNNPANTVVHVTEFDTSSWEDDDFAEAPIPVDKPVSIENFHYTSITQNTQVSGNLGYLGVLFNQI